VSVTISGKIIKTPSELFPRSTAAFAKVVLGEIMTTGVRKERTNKILRVMCFKFMYHNLWRGEMFCRYWSRLYQHFFRQ